MLFFRTTKILKFKKKNASTKLNSPSRKIKKSKNFFVFFSERTRVGALKFFFSFPFPPLNPRTLVSERKLLAIGVKKTFPQSYLHGNDKTI